MTKGTVGARFLWSLRRITPESAVGMEPPAKLSDRQMEVFKAACLYACRIVVPELRRDLKRIGKDDPLGRTILASDAIKMAVRYRDAHCRYHLGLPGEKWWQVVADDCGSKPL